MLLLGGSQDQWYRFESAVRALATLVRSGVDAALIVTGRLGWKPAAEAAAEADRLLSELGIAERVELVGTYTQQEAPALFNRADIVLHTKYNDPCPTAVIEALCVRPTGGLFEQRRSCPSSLGRTRASASAPSRPGIATCRRIPSALAEAVSRVHAQLPAYAVAARRRAVERFDVRQWITRHRQVFQGLLA